MLRFLFTRVVSGVVESGGRRLRSASLHRQLPVFVIDMNSTICRPWQALATSLAQVSDSLYGVHGEQHKL